MEFDFPISDGRDWISTGVGLKVLIDKNDAEFLQGQTIGFQDGEFAVMTERG